MSEYEGRGPKEVAYDNEVSPLISQVIALCKKYKINMAAQFSLDANDEDRTMFCTTCLHDVDLDDQEGIDRMKNLRSVMYPPAPYFAAFTITTK